MGQEVVTTPEAQAKAQSALIRSSTCGGNRTYSSSMAKFPKVLPSGGLGDAPASEVGLHQLPFAVGSCRRLYRKRPVPVLLLSCFSDFLGGHRPFQHSLPTLFAYERSSGAPRPLFGNRPRGAFVSGGFAQRRAKDFGRGILAPRRSAGVVRLHPSGTLRSRRFCNGGSAGVHAGTDP